MSAESPKASGSTQRFDETERASMLALKGVGPTVVQRLEELGFSSLAELAQVDAASINKAVSQMLHATCWANSPLARQAIERVVALANERHPSPAR